MKKALKVFLTGICIVFLILNIATIVSHIQYNRAQEESVRISREILERDLIEGRIDGSKYLMKDMQLDDIEDDRYFEAPMF
ncbi:MAG: hypothetical protein ACTSUC_06385 [Promethearchaeota archaeon]